MIKFTQQWFNWTPVASPPSNEVVPYSVLSVRCNDGATLVHVFPYPTTESVELEVTEGAMCHIDYHLPFSAFETDSSCEEYVAEGSDCIFESVEFSESVPTIGLAGIVILVVSCVVIGLKCLR